MKPETILRHQLTLHEAATRRLGDVETFKVGERDIHVALPASYNGKKQLRYPVILVLDTGQQLGSVIEMSRLMTQTSEVHPVIVVGVPVFDSELADVACLACEIGDVLEACDQQYRTSPDDAIVFAHGAAGRCVLQWMLESTTPLRRFIVGDPLPCTTAKAVAASAIARSLVLCAGTQGIGGKSLASIADNLSTVDAKLKVTSRTLDDVDTLVATLDHGLRMLLATGKKYGDEILPMRRPLMMNVLRLFSPLLGRLTAKPPLNVVDDSRYRLHSKRLSRDFEVFVIVPPSAAADSTRRYPALVVLDANIELSVAAETAARMAARGETEELIIIGIGVPRAEGPVAFGYRRFEELSPPADGYDYRDDLGRIFRSLFSLRGQDARTRLGRAPDLLAFIVDEMLPQLSALPIDSARLGLLGHSAGGTFAAYALSQPTSPFQHYFAISPGIGISGSWLMRQPPSAAAVGRSAVLSLGSEELQNGFNNIAGIHDTPAFSQRLREQPGVDVSFRCFDGETHSSIFPRALSYALASRYSVAGENK
jgi:predicted alpha/beta superfamily hydrolase